MRRKLTDQAAEWAYEKWLDGYSMSEIERELEISHCYLRAAFDERGLTRVVPPLRKPDFPIWEEKRDEDYRAKYPRLRQEREG